jgi:hypothetical protein
MTDSGRNQDTIDGDDNEGIVVKEKDMPFLPSPARELVDVEANKNNNTLTNTKSDNEQQVQQQDDEDDEVDIVITVGTRMGLVVFSALYTVFYSGALFGWGPMQLMLEDDGAFGAKCSTNEEEYPCGQQTILLSQVFFVATLMSLFSPLLGYLSDSIGALFLMQLLTLFTLLGIAIVMIGSATDTYQLLFIGFSFIGLAFYSSCVMTVKTGLVMGGGASQRRVISLLNTLIDAGTLAFFLLRLIQEKVDASFLAMMGGYLGGAVFCFGGAVYFWYKVVKATEAALEGVGKTPAGVEPTIKGATQTERVSTMSVTYNQEVDEAEKGDNENDNNHNGKELPVSFQVDPRKQYAASKVISYPAEQDDDSNSYTLIRKRKPCKFIFVCVFVFHDWQSFMFPVYCYLTLLFDFFRRGSIEISSIRVGSIILCRSYRSNQLYHGHLEGMVGVTR